MGIKSQIENQVLENIKSQISGSAGSNPTPPTEGMLLLEDGFYFLLEDGSYLLVT